MFEHLVNHMKVLLRQNWLLTLAALALLITGVFFVYSSCYISEEAPVRTLYKRQILWAGVGLLCYLTLAAIDYRDVRSLSGWLYGTSIVLLLLVLIIGTYTHGAQRRLEILGISVQPSEIAKLATILLLAGRLSQPDVRLVKSLPLLNVALMIGVPVLLILKEPDLGTAMVFIPTSFVMMFVAGVSRKVLAVPIVVGLLVVGVILGAAVIPAKMEMPKPTRDRVWTCTGLSLYQRDRVMVYLGLDKDPLGAGWNKKQSMIAVGSGGKWGKGFLKGTQNVLGFLPRSVAPTDFIYSVIAEEKGFFGSAVVLSMFAVVLGAGILTASRTRSVFGRLLCVGVTTMIFCHVFINIGMTVGLMPITGLPLPLLSYGGSFMVVMMSALGLIQSVYIRSRRAPTVDGVAVQARFPGF